MDRGRIFLLFIDPCFHQSIITSLLINYTENKKYSFKVIVKYFIIHREDYLDFLLLLSKCKL